MGSIDNVKKGLRSVLMVPGGLTLGQILKDYEELMGESINYRGFGYSQPFDFLKSLTDVLRPKGFCRKTQQQLFEVVPNENTHHIKKLVDNQKRTLKKGNNNYRKPLVNTNNFARREYPQPQLFDKFYPTYNNAPQPKELKQKERSKEPEIKWSALEEPELHPQTIEKLKKMFFTYPRGIRKTRIPEVFYNAFKLSLEVHVNEVLEKMTELLTYEEDGVTYVCLNEFYQKNIVPKLYQQSQTCTKSTTEQRNRPTSRKSIQSSQSSSRNESPSDRIHKNLKLSFFQILDKHPNGIFAMDFIREFEDMKKYPLEPPEYGFNSFPDMINSLTSIFAIGPMQNNEGDYMLLDARKPKESNNDTCKQNSPDHFKKMNELLVNLFQLFNQLNPISLSSVDDHYLKMFNESIPWKFVGFGSLEQLFVDMNGFFEIIADQEKNEKYISRKLNMGQESRRPSTSPDHLMNASAPPDTYSLFEYVIQILPLDKDPKLFQPVYISDVYSPHNFYIQFAFCEEAFNSLMNVIGETYNNPKVAAAYKIPAQDLRLNMLCVAPFPGESWHRASILGFIPDKHDQVKVFYIDYGTTATIKSDELCYIKKDLMLLPAQAIKCKLLNCIPFGSDEWPAYSTPFFLELTQGIKLSAQFLRCKDGIHHINLCDVNGDVDSYILDRMVESCIALYVDDDYYDDEEEEILTENEEEVINLPNGLEQDSSLSESHVNPSQISGCQPKLVKRIELARGYYPFHLILEEDELYMSEKEVSSIFIKKGSFINLWQSYNIDVPSIVLAENENPILFDQMRRFKIADAFLGNAVLLYSIRGVIVMLIELGHPFVKEIAFELLKEEDSFDPISKWGKFSSSVINDEPVFERSTQFTSELTHIELLIALESTNVQRKDALTRGAATSPTVGILSEKIEEFRKRMNEIETACKELKKMVLED